jgi:hypothetical protein
MVMFVVSVFGMGLLFLGSGHESDHRREAAIDLIEITYVAPMDRVLSVA